MGRKKKQKKVELETVETPELTGDVVRIDILEEIDSALRAVAKVEPIPEIEFTEEELKTQGYTFLKEKGDKLVYTKSSRRKYIFK